MGHLRPLFPYWFFIEWSWVHWWTETWLSKISKQADPDSFQMGLRLYEILCVPSKIGVYVSHSPLALPNAKTYWPSKSDVLGTHLSAGPMMWGSDPSFLGETPAIIVILLFVSHQPGFAGLDYAKSPLLLSISLWFFLLILGYGKIFSASLQIIPIDSCSINNCNFCVPVGGGELRVFLLDQLSHVLSFW